MKPKILLLDIETAPILAHVWQLWKVDVGLPMIKKDWHILSYAAKWFNKPGILYKDQRDSKVIEDDTPVLSEVWKLLNECDILITQNGKQFDVKKLNARFIQQGFKPYSSFKHIDTRQIAKNKFGFTSNKLEYLADKLNKKYKKLKHTRFAGFDLWKECLAGNVKAWNEMKKYNIYDVLALEELYNRLQPWDNSINYNLYEELDDYTCSCGSTIMSKNGFCYTSVGKYQRYECKKCGAEARSRKNLGSVDRVKV